MGSSRERPSTRERSSSRERSTSRDRTSPSPEGRSWRASLRKRFRGGPAACALLACASLLLPKVALALVAFGVLMALAAALLHLGTPSWLLEGELRLGDGALRFRRPGQVRSDASLQGRAVAVDLLAQRGVWDVTLFDERGRSMELRLAELERASLLAALGLDGAPPAAVFPARGPFGLRGLLAMGGALAATAVLVRLLGPRLDEGDRVAWALVVAAVVWAPVLVARVVSRVVRVGKDGLVVSYGLAARRVIDLADVSVEPAGVFVQIFRGDELVDTVECSSPRAARELEKSLEAWRSRAARA